MAQQSRRAQRCANTKMPEGLTEQVIARINDLPSSVATDYLKSELLTKFVSDDTDPPLTRRTRAINKWLATERDNEATNDRLFLTPEDFMIMPRVSYGSFVSFCQSLIIDIIGETVPEEALIGSFSGGASTSRPRTESHPASKYLGKTHATASAYEVFFDQVVEELPGWLLDGDIDPIVVPGNVMFTVPKKTDIDRCAAKEPDLNMFIQKGAGSYISKCLRRIGINLNDQSRNRSLARSGSLTGDLVTFDLSSASDSVTSELVFTLLPVCWYTFLDSVRSRVTIIDGQEHQNHMFSSMGNGFTFELESLLFYVLTRAICHFDGVRGVVSVYGDDIICPTGIADILPYVFKYFGFTVNSDKSCTSGPLRESCGGHYYNGTDITPFYLKDPIKRLTDLIDIANKVRNWAFFDCHSILNPEVEDLWFWLKSMIPSDLWGGWNTESIYQLASPDMPRHRLVEEETRKRTGKGGYYHWLNATWDREELRDGVSTSLRTITSSRFRDRKSVV